MPNPKLAEVVMEREGEAFSLAKNLLCSTLEQLES